jgi:FkbH-like protein
VREMRLFPATEINSGPAAASLASSLEERTDSLVGLWWRLGAIGPTCGSDQAGDEAFSRERYLRPLARLLIGALRDQIQHRAMYLDERLRYLPSGLDLAARADFLAPRLAVESAAVASLAGGAIPRAATRRLLADLHEPLTSSPTGDSLRLLLVGDSIFNGTRAFLTHTERAGGRVVDVEHLSVGELTPAGLSMGHVVDSIQRRPAHVLALSLFSYEGFPAYPALLAQRLSRSRSRTRTAGLARLLQDAVDAIREITDAPLLLHNACGLPLDRLRRRIRWLPAHDTRRERVIGELNQQVASVAAASENVILIDEVALVAANGGLRACAAPVFAPADVPDAVFHPAQLEVAMAETYATALSAVRALGAAKAVLVDFDNTLWSGVMAEGPVVHDRVAQRLLKRLRQAGILLVALSKNDPATIRWDEMELTPDDFVLHKFGWQPKSQTAAEAVAELGLAPGSFVLLDDNPAERMIVTQAIPEIAALDPGVPVTWRMLDTWLALPSAKQTPEARRRTEMYREAADRRPALASGRDYGQIMADLHVAADFRKARMADLDRLAELINRTNQFNTTTLRRTKSQIRELLRSGRHAVYVASFRDRFGDLGLVAAVIVERTEPDLVVFDSVVMSCRAMGFGLEKLLVRRTIDAEPAGSYCGMIFPTERNKPAAGLFRDMGFTEAPGGNWVLGPGAQAEAAPEWFGH